MTNEIYPGYAKELADKETRDRSAAQAGSVPLPGPLREAFAATAKQFEPLTCGHIAILQEINSPLLEMAKVFSIKKTPEERQAALNAIHFGEKDVAELYYIFTHKPPQLRAALREGRDAFAERVACEVLDTFPAGALAESFEKMVSHFASAFSTQLSFTSSESDVGFQSPPAQPSTASVGGLKSTVS